MLSSPFHSPHLVCTLPCLLVLRLKPSEFRGFLFFFFFRYSKLMDDSMHCTKTNRKIKIYFFFHVDPHRSLRVVQVPVLYSVIFQSAILIKRNKWGISVKPHPTPSGTL